MLKDYTVGDIPHKLRKFKANTSHHKLTWTEIAKLYGVAGTTVTKRFYVAIGRMPEGKSSAERSAAQLALFIATPEDHNLGHAQLIAKYKVASSTVSNRFFPAISRVRRSEREAVTRDTIMSDPLFVEEEGRAGCTHKVLAAKHGVSASCVQRLRQLHGVRPTTNRAEPHRSPALSRNDKSAFALCKLTHGWGRPSGMTAHLESLQ